MTGPARKRLFAASETGYGRVFDVAQEFPWPAEFGGRALVNGFFDEWVGREDEMDDAARRRHELARGQVTSTSLTSTRVRESLHSQASVRHEMSCSTLHEPWVARGRGTLEQRMPHLSKAASASLTTVVTGSAEVCRTGP